MTRFLSLALLLLGSTACKGDADDSGATGVAGADPDAWVVLESSDTFSCALNGAGETACWGPPAGYPYEGHTLDTLPAKPWVDIALGGWALCAVNVDGEVGCATTDERPETASQAPGAGDFVSVECSAGASCCALDTAGNATCWGVDPNEDWANEDFLTPRTGSFVELALWAQTVCGVNESGAFECWGEDLGYRHTIRPSSSAWSAVAMHRDTTCGVDDGEIHCWEDGPDWDQAPTSAEPFVDVKVRYRHACGLDADNWMRCRGTTGLAEADASVLDGPPEQVTAFSLGDGFGCAAAMDGDGIVCWGDTAFSPAAPVGDGSVEGLGVVWQ